MATPEIPKKSEDRSQTRRDRAPRLITPRLIAEIGLMAAILEVSKTALALVPNVELVSLEIILFTLYLGAPALIAVFAFVGAECLVWGLGLWSITYLYIWPILVALTLLSKRKENTPGELLYFSILSGVYGLFFGALCSIPFLFIGGIKSAFGMWIAGIPYDLIHCIGNFFICLILYKPLHGVMERLKSSRT